MTDAGTDAQTSTRDRIIEAALGLMTERGFAGVTMKAVAETAGIARQTLYNHFPDVDSIVAEAIETHQIDSLNSLRSVLATIESPVARLEHLVRQAAAAAVHHHPAAGIQQGLSAEMQATLQEHDVELISIIEGALRAGIESDEFRADLDIATDAQLIKRMLDAVAELTSANPEGLHVTVAAATRTLLASVTAFTDEPS
jgi:AcrR family transcriptional regulator